MAYILALDDNQGMQEVIRETLETFGHQVICGGNGHVGLELLTSMDRLPDLIITDMIMPDMDGATFLSHVRNTKQWSSIPVVLMSGHKDDCRMVDYSETVAFIEKPFRVPALIEIINHLMSPRQASEAS